MSSHIMLIFPQLHEALPGSVLITEPVVRSFSTSCWINKSHNSAGLSHALQRRDVLHMLLFLSFFVFFLFSP